MNGGGTILGREPALIAGAVDAIINVLIAFHVIVLSGDQIAQINVAMAATFPLIVRQAVTPMAWPRLGVATSGRLPVREQPVRRDDSPGEHRAHRAAGG